VGARRLELQTSSLSVLHENRNFLPIKHLQNAPNALFRAKRIDSVHDTVQTRRGFASPITPVKLHTASQVYRLVSAKEEEDSPPPCPHFFCLACWPQRGQNRGGGRSPQLVIPPRLPLGAAPSVRLRHAPTYMRFFRIYPRPAVPVVVVAGYCQLSDRLDPLTPYLNR
jgi:hypothetical protein